MKQPAQSEPYQFSVERTWLGRILYSLGIPSRFFPRSWCFGKPTEKITRVGVLFFFLMGIWRAVNWKA